MTLNDIADTILLRTHCPAMQDTQDTLIRTLYTEIEARDRLLRQIVDDPMTDCRQSFVAKVIAMIGKA